MKEKEGEEADRLAEQNDQNSMAGGDDSYFDNQRNTPYRPPTPTPQKQSGGQWYFYNQVAINQDKTTFERLWEKRENVDNWQRINKMVVSFGDTNQTTGSQLDSLQQAETVTDSLSQVPDSAQNSPHKRAYYLA